MNITAPVVRAPREITYKVMEGYFHEQICSFGHDIPEDMASQTAVQKGWLVKNSKHLKHCFYGDLCDRPHLLSGVPLIESLC